MEPDFRSDTVTRPGTRMRAAMAAAEVGDDVLGEDPTVRRLEAVVAARLGHSAGLFVPSGTMANQLAVRAHTQPGEQVLLEDGCHIYRYEAGGPGALSGVQLTPIPSQDGILSVEVLAAALNPDDIHCAQPSLVCVENTHNRHGGTIWPVTQLHAVAASMHERGLRVHMDGARLWNAAVAMGRPESDWASQVDSVAVCFSKGLGAPVGSMLCGSEDFVRRARRLRKQWGGGMRQVGILAAACLYALESNYEQLHEDHERARWLAASIEHPALRLLRPPASNIVLFEVSAAGGAAAVQAALRSQGVLVSTMGPTRLRLVTHRDVDHAACERAAATIRQLCL